MSDQLYKVLRADGMTTFGRPGWALPNGKPGAWSRVKGPLRACENGLHLCRVEHLLRWAGPVLYEAETQGQVIDAGDKIVARKARLVRRVDTWNDSMLRLLAADCAEYALTRERDVGREPDARSWAAISAVRAYVRGEISKGDLDDARAAAWAAARATTWDDAWAAARAATWAATSDAAWDAEHDWQTTRLAEYLTGDAA